MGDIVRHECVVNNPRRLPTHFVDLGKRKRMEGFLEKNTEEGRIEKQSVIFASVCQ